jgi:hypothetical protein
MLINHEKYLMDMWDIVKCIQVMQGVTERYGQTLGTNFTYQDKTECPYQYVSGSISFVSYSGKSTHK